MMDEHLAPVAGWGNQRDAAQGPYSSGKSHIDYGALFVSAWKHGQRDLGCPFPPETMKGA